MLSDDLTPQGGTEKSPDFSFWVSWARRHMSCPDDTGKYLCLMENSSDDRAPDKTKDSNC